MWMQNVYVCQDIVDSINFFVKKGMAFVVMHIFYSSSILFVQFVDRGILLFSVVNE